MTDPAAGSSRGKVYLVGAGPGDPGLITLRGTQLLQRADVVVYDYLANRKLLRHAPDHAELVYAGKKGGGLHAFTQQAINQMLIKHALRGKTVVRLKGGDPFIFGRGAEEIEALVEQNIPFEVVPGVTSATAAATYAGIPITHRGYTASVAFVTGHEDPAKKKSTIAWDKLATGAGTLVIYMGIKNLPVITRKLIEHGRSPDTPVAVVRWASTPEQHSVEGTLATITEVVTEAGIRPPALVIVGDVVKLRQTIDWFEKRPLFGKRIVVTRTRQQASELVSLLEENGAACLEYPTIHIEPVEDYTILDTALDNLADYQWILFTSINAVTWFFKRLAALGHDTRHLHGVRIAAVGRTTANQLQNHGLTPDLLPKKFTGEGLAESLIQEGVAKQQLLLPRALEAREVLVELLTAAGASVTVAPVYRNVPPMSRKEEIRRQLQDGKIDLITFTSSSTVTNFLAMLDPDDRDELLNLLRDVKIAAIGPITAKTVTENGLAVHIQPERYTIPDLVHAIVHDYQSSAVTG